MRYKKRVEKTVQAYETTSRCVCDFCGTDYDPEGIGGYDRSSVTLEAELGEVYPETDTRTVTGFDCCVPCWEAKVRPALEALGAKAYEYDYEDGRTRSTPFEPGNKRECARCGAVERDTVQQKTRGCIRAAGHDWSAWGPASQLKA